MSLKATSLAMTWWLPSRFRTALVKRKIVTTAKVTDTERMMVSCQMH